MKYTIKLFVCFVFLLLIFVPFLFFNMDSNAKNLPSIVNYNDLNHAYSDDSVEILFTHDLHSYLSSYKEMYDGKVQSLGGVPRLKTLIDNVKTNNPNLLIVDGGDITIGTLYQTLYSTEALELRLLGKLGFDATTLGNHDFDYPTSEFIKMFKVAASKEDYLPSFVISNIDWGKDDEDTKNLKEAASLCNLCDYKVVNKGKYKIALFGIFGKVATEDSPTLTLTVLDQIESAKRTVQYIKDNEDIDMIVCLSHSGTNSNIKESEDEQLALAVPDIDVIISGHSHTLLDEAIVHDNTTIVSCGCYGLYTGLASFIPNDNGRWKLDQYNIIPMTDDVPEDKEIKDFVESFDDEIDSTYLSDYSIKSQEILAINPYNFNSVDDMYYSYGDHELGNFISDAYRYAGVKYSDSQEKTIAVVPAGTVRATLLKGEITSKDAFECYSLGVGTDGKTGYPLIKLYLTGKEVKLIPEIDASLSPMMSSANLYISGMSYTSCNKRIFLNKAYNIKYLTDNNLDSSIDINDDDLYAVICDMYTAKMIGSVSKLSKGLINIKPKYKDGSILESDEKDYIWKNIVIRDDNGNEVKAWIAIASYLKTFDKNEDGISVIPEEYAKAQGRKEVNNTFSFSNFFKDTNIYFWAISLIFILAIVIFIIFMKFLAGISYKIYQKLFIKN